MRINRQDTNGVKPLLQVGELGYDNYPGGGDAGRVFVGTGTENISLGKKTEIIAVDTKVNTHTARVDNPHSVTKSQVGLGSVQNIDTTNASNITSGTLSADRLAVSGVGTGTYKSVTVDNKGRVTAGSNPTTLAGYGITDADTSAQVTTKINNAVAALVDASPATLDTLNELAAALGDDPNFATTTANNIAAKVAKVTSTDNAIVRFDGTTGDVQNSGVTIDDSGNVGIGVTPSAWSSGMKAVDIGQGTAVLNENSLATSTFAANCYYNGGWKYKNNYSASLYAHDGTSHVWSLAPSGTAGNTITFTIAMSLDSNGDLIVPHTYLNTTASAANMFVDSTGKFFRSTSSKQYKKDIETIDKAYVDTFFNKARPIYYKSRSENDNPTWGYWGFIAEEIAEFDKRLVHWRYQTKDIEVEKERIIPDIEEIRNEKDEIIQEAFEERIEKYIEIEQVKDESKPLVAEGVMYERITVLLTAKVQEQQKIIDNLISRIETLEGAN